MSSKKGFSGRDIVVIVFAVMAIFALVGVLVFLNSQQKQKNQQIKEQAQQQLQEMQAELEIERVKQGEGIIINEVAYGWVELCNPTRVDAELSELKLILGGKEYPVGNGVLKAGDFYVVELSGKAFDGEADISLFSGNRKLLQTFYVPEIMRYESYASVENKGIQYAFAEMTKGASNAGAIKTDRKVPVIMLPAGYYTGDVTVEIQVPEGTTVYYSLDGSDPTEASNKYEKAFTLTNATYQPNVYSARTDISMKTSYIPGDKVSKVNILKAVAVDTEGRKSEIVTSTYMISMSEKEQYSGLPVLSVVADTDELFDFFRGIYVLGRSYSDALVSGKGTNSSANFANGWKINANIECFDENQIKKEEYSSKLSVFSDYSMPLLQKSFLIEKDGQNYILSSGNEDAYIKARNAVLCDIADEYGIYAQKSEYCVVYLNGEYWGVYLKRDVLDPNSVAERIGTKPENIQLLGNEHTMDPETINAWEETLLAIVAADLTDDEAYNEISRLIDLEGLAMAYCTHLYAADSKFPDEGMFVYRDIAGADKRWKFILGDFDATAEIGEVNAHFADSFLKRSISEDYILYSLLRNEQFKKLFEKTMQEVSEKMFTAEKVRERLQSIENKTVDALVETFIRFHGNMTKKVMQEVFDEFEGFFTQRKEYMDLYLTEFLSMDRERKYCIKYDEDGNVEDVVLEEPEEDPAEGTQNEGLMPEITKVPVPTGEVPPIPTKKPEATKVITPSPVLTPVPTVTEVPAAEQKKGYIYFSVDDSTYDVDLSVYLVTVEHGFPITLATEVQKLDDKVTGISNYNKDNGTELPLLGTTVREVCHWVSEHGGEIAVHDMGFVWDKENTAKNIKAYYANAHEEYNAQNGTNMTQEEFIEFVCKRLEESDNYNLDEEKSALIHFYDRKKILEEEGFVVKGILGSGGSFYMSDFSRRLSIKSWGTEKAGEWAKKYYIYSDQYGTKEPYFNVRHQVCGFVTGGTNEVHGTFQEDSFRAALDRAVEKQTLYPIYWHYVNGTENTTGKQNSATLEMYRRMLEIVQEYVDAGKIQVVNPGDYYKQ